MRTLMFGEQQAVAGGLVDGAGPGSVWLAAGSATERTVYDDGSVLVSGPAGTYAFDTDGNLYTGGNYCNSVGTAIGDVLGPTIVGALCPETGPFVMACNSILSGPASTLTGSAATAACDVGAFTGPARRSGGNSTGSSFNGGGASGTWK